MIEQFFTWPLTVERRIGTTSKGVRYADPTVEMCRIRMVSEQVTTDSGDVVTTVATCSMAETTVPIPPGSRATLPPELTPQGRPAQVAVSGLHKSGDALPAFYQVQLTGGA